MTKDWIPAFAGMTGASGRRRGLNESIVLAVHIFWPFEFAQGDKSLYKGFCFLLTDGFCQFLEDSQAFGQALELLAGGFVVLLVAAVNVGFF